MSLHPQYARPRTFDQAIALIAGMGAGVAMLAGGQELMPHINHARLMPNVLLDLNALPELTGIVLADDAISIGALTVHRAVQSDPHIVTHAPLLAHAAGQVGGGWQVHNRGTIGGNIASFHPLYDILPALVAHQAQVEIGSEAGRRIVSLERLLAETHHGLGTSSILMRVIVPGMPAGAGWAYEKLKITDGSYGSANAAAIVLPDTAGRVRSCRVVLGAVSERPIDASEALARLTGRLPDSAMLAEIDAVCASLVEQPLDDQQGACAYRRAMAGVVARRAVQAALARIGSSRGDA